MGGSLYSTLRRSVELASCRPYAARMQEDWLLDFDAIAFDHGICQQFVGHFGSQGASLPGFRCLEIELEVLPLPHVVDSAVPERMQCVRDGLPLRIEHRRF